ncbi:membrane protein required for colicin V production [Inhella inkyongensis]|uniref:Membrane protein required for colicin V production n=1 Tax=Inhella inkyongensis TaxID=392593 RepID=A0A840S7G8_9BURK|nr:CvpA family protein [Inhella inkyongensis]MBB5205552.1 membrane protein required for colicin V production [Inhella inkyongensis]
MTDSFFLSWADLMVLVLLLISLVVGAWRGLVLEVFSLAAWVLAYFAAPWLAPVVEGWLPAKLSQGGWQELAALVLAFVLILMLCGLCGRLLRMLLHATPLAFMDRLLGAGFGLLRGLLLALLAAVLIGFTPFKRHPAWTDSQARPILHALLQAAAPMLPKSLQDLLESRKT